MELKELKGVIASLRIKPKVMLMSEAILNC